MAERLAVGEGILVHGRFVGAQVTEPAEGEVPARVIDWDGLEIGVPELDRAGSLTRMLKLILDHGIEPVGRIVFGTGASRGAYKGRGMYEADLTKAVLLDNVDRIGSAFPAIGGHPNNRFPADRRLLRSTLEGIVTDTTSKNTKEEIGVAAGLFEEAGVSEVYQITNGSHGPRCGSLQWEARRRGEIPGAQSWYLATDDMSFGGPTTIIEYPHRLDGPEELRGRPVFASVVKGFFGLEPAAQAVAIDTMAAMFDGLKDLSGAS